jgi:hypothetical protein
LVALFGRLINDRSLLVGSHASFIPENAVKLFPVLALYLFVRLRALVTFH